MSREFGLIMQVEKLDDIFMHRWMKYCNAVVDFSNATKNKPKELQHALRDDDSSTEGK